LPIERPATIRKFKTDLNEPHYFVLRNAKQLIIQQFNLTSPHLPPARWELNAEWFHSGICTDVREKRLNCRAASIISRHLMTIFVNSNSKSHLNASSKCCSIKDLQLEGNLVSFPLDKASDFGGGPERKGWRAGKLHP
jgi:hypothetical protein